MRSIRKFQMNFKIYSSFKISNLILYPLSNNSFLAENLKIAKNIRKDNQKIIRSYLSSSLDRIIRNLILLKKFIDSLSASIEQNLAITRWLSVACRNSHVCIEHLADTQSARANFSIKGIHSHPKNSLFLRRLILCRINCKGIDRRQNDIFNI